PEVVARDRPAAVVRNPNGLRIRDDPFGARKAGEANPPHDPVLARADQQQPRARAGPDPDAGAADGDALRPRPGRAEPDRLHDAVSLQADPLHRAPGETLDPH